MKDLCIFILYVFIASSFFISEVDSDCCIPSGDAINAGYAGLNGKCADYTSPNPCCGYGPCNTFCCNCDGGCRTGLRIHTNISHGFGQIDSNRNEKVSLEEAKKHFVSGSADNLPKNVVEEFARMDLDQDGFLSREEIDPASK